GHALVLPGAGASELFISERASSVGDGATRGHTLAVDTLQDQSVAVRLSDIKEEARARRSHEQRFSSAPGDSR
ncbi:hypothetical protein, partial [Ramlibacter sp. AN1133]|uniref:hypothetical protein n=1 Tax=Ramlibacter sp. AN1133 TaxID=3133429 RepID=UPI0030C0493B